MVDTYLYARGSLLFGLFVLCVCLGRLRPTKDVAEHVLVSEVSAVSGEEDAIVYDDKFHAMLFHEDFLFQAELHA